MPKMFEKYIKSKEETERCLERLKACPTMKEIDEEVRRIFPDWIVEYSTDYSSDYPHLQKNWAMMSEACGVNRALIMIVDYIGTTDDFGLMQAVCELYTSIGFIIRSVDEVEVCPVCFRAIPGKAQWKAMLESGLDVPKDYSTHCLKCVQEE